MIAFGYCLPAIHEGLVHGPFVASLVEMLAYDMTHKQVLTSMLTEVSAYIPVGRNRIVERFLSETQEEWLLFLDYDMVSDATLLYKLLEMAGDSRRVIGALYFNPKNMPDGKTYTVPVWRVFGTDGFLQMAQVSPQVQEVAAIGMGFTLIHRTVLEKMKAVFKDDPWHWYGHDIIQTADGPIRAGEDVTFCIRAKKAGFPVFGAPLACQHIKSKRVTLEDYKAQVQRFTEKGQP